LCSVLHNGFSDQVTTMSYAILRIEKLKTKSEIAGRSNHNHRIMPVTNSDTQINNRQLLGTSDALADWQQRIEEAQVTKIRKNAVLAYEVLMTFSHDSKEKMLNLTNGNGELALDRFVNDSIDFIKEKFNEKNIVNAVLHLDESTPHIHAIIVPEFEGKLNARHFTGGKQKMRELQDGYYDALKPAFSKLLRRGKTGSKAKHINIQQFYADGPGIIDKLEKENAELKGLVDDLSLQLHSFTSNPAPSKACH